MVAAATVPMTKFSLYFMLSLLRDDPTVKMPATVKKHHWAYDGAEGPDHWHSHYPLCAGTHQSPIDIRTQACQYDSTLPDFTLHNYHLPSTKVGVGCSLNFTNNGHAASVRVSDADMWVEGGGLTNRYKTAEFHFHWGNTPDSGSEHAVDGVKFPLEMHVVNYATKYGTLARAMQEPDGLAVLGVLFEVSETDNPVFAPVADALQYIHKAGDYQLLEGVQVRSLLPEDTSRYWRYSGSLTTPRCYETVTWTVFAEPQKISRHQVEQLRHLLHESGHDGPDVEKNSPSQIIQNWRPVQRLNGRVVRQSFPGSASPTLLQSSSQSPSLGPSTLPSAEMTTNVSSFLHEGNLSSTTNPSGVTSPGGSQTTVPASTSSAPRQDPTAPTSAAPAPRPTLTATSLFPYTPTFFPRLHTPTVPSFTPAGPVRSVPTLSAFTTRPSTPTGLFPGQTTSPTGLLSTTALAPDFKDAASTPPVVSSGGVGNSGVPPFGVPSYKWLTGLGEAERRNLILSGASTPRGMPGEGSQSVAAKPPSGTTLPQPTNAPPVLSRTHLLDLSNRLSQLLLPGSSSQPAPLSSVTLTSRTPSDAGGPQQSATSTLRPTAVSSPPSLSPLDRLLFMRANLYNSASAGPVSTLTSGAAPVRTQSYPVYSVNNNVGPTQPGSDVRPDVFLHHFTQPVRIRRPFYQQYYNPAG